MEITPKVLSIPPYLSTTWENIAALKTEKVGGAYTLKITLKTGDQVSIPSLPESDINSILEAHAQYLQPTNPLQNPKFPIPFSFSLPFNRAEGPIPSLGESMHHNPEQSDLPDIPPEVLDKVAIIAKAFGFDDFSALEQAQPDCNCVYCQLKRAFTSNHDEERINDEDLHFRDWEVNEVSDQLYTVISPLDKNEQYRVFLGQPLGCTCGQKNCEHLKAVLHS